MQSRELRVKVGTWLYDGSVSSQVVILHRGVWRGTGDYEDVPSIAEDAELETFEVLYAVANEPDKFSGGGQFGALADAVAAANSACGPSLVWMPDRYFSRDEIEQSPDPQGLCRVLQVLIQHRLAHASDPAREAQIIATDLRAAGHDIWSWDESQNFSIWGDDYVNPPRPTQFLLEMRWPSSGTRDEQTEVEITFGPWPKK